MGYLQLFFGSISLCSNFDCKASCKLKWCSLTSLGCKQFYIAECRMEVNYPAPGRNWSPLYVPVRRCFCWNPLHHALSRLEPMRFLLTRFASKLESLSSWMKKLGFVESLRDPEASKPPQQTSMYLPGVSTILASGSGSGIQTASTHDQGLSTEILASRHPGLVLLAQQLYAQVVWQWFWACEVSRWENL